jgi:hypothetical protein
MLSRQETIEMKQERIEMKQGRIGIILCLNKNQAPKALSYSGTKDAPRQRRVKLAAKLHQNFRRFSAL